MTPFPLPLIDGDTLLIDNSSLEHFSTCPRQAYYSIVRKLKSSGERSALVFGGIIHKILETRYRACTSLAAQTDQVTNMMLAVAEREFAKWTPLEDDFRTYSCAVEFIRRYEEQYPFEQFEVVRGHDGSPMIEVPFAIPLGEIDHDGKVIKIVWTGKIDLVYISQNGGGLYVMDHKTTSIMGPNFAVPFEISHQLYGYAWAVEQLTGKDVSAVVVNGLGMRKPTKTGKAFEFMRPVIPVQRQLVDEWKLDTMHIVSDFLENCRRGYAPKHSIWCVNKFGECPFRKVCTLSSQEQREIMLESGEFVKNEWSPLK